MKKKYLYIIKRILSGLLVLWGVSLIAFILLHITPGDPARLLLPQGATDEEINNLREELGLNRPLYTQYLVYMKGVIKGDLGTSLYYKKPNLDIIMERIPATLTLSVVSIFLTVLIGLPLGIIAGVKRGTFLDHFAVTFSILGQSLSIVWSCILLVYIFAIKLRLLPSFGYGSIAHIILPAFALAIEGAAAITRLTRAGMIDILSEDYILTIRAKGIKENKVIYRYALKNVLISITTVIGLIFAALMGGQLVCESIFVWPGIGQLTVKSIYGRDFPLVQAIMIVIALFYVTINLFVDIIYTLIDPRLKYD